MNPNPKQQQQFSASAERAKDRLGEPTPPEGQAETPTSMPHIENNLDLIYGREIVLDYLRMRMAEEVFHLGIIQQIKDKVQQKFSAQLNQEEKPTIGLAKFEEFFDVEYQIKQFNNLENTVLFRLVIRLMKLPSQFSYVTTNQIIDCIETFLISGDKEDDWQPNIEDRVVNIKWDESAKPIPMLVLEQTDELPFELDANQVI